MILRSLGLAIALCFGGCATTFSASAQSLLEVLAGMKFCRTLKDDSQRLKCFDELFAEKPITQEEPGKVEKEVAWTITEGKSPIDDSPQVTASLFPPGANVGMGLLGAPALVLRCKESEWR
jgi:hypothetical protein